jgi:dihydrofolate reductase
VRPVISLLVAVSRNGVIGKDGKLPWHIPSELKRFKAVSMGKPIIMGRKTWESLPRKPLPGRTNIVLTAREGWHAEGAVTAAGIDAALVAAGDVPEVCVIGGGEIYQLFLPRATRVYLTEVDCKVEGDTYFAPLDPAIWREVGAVSFTAESGDSYGYTIKTLERWTFPD